jgi:hypothetical protein
MRRMQRTATHEANERPPLWADQRALKKNERRTAMDGAMTRGG